MRNSPSLRFSGRDLFLIPYIKDRNDLLRARLHPCMTPQSQINHVINSCKVGNVITISSIVKPEEKDPFMEWKPKPQLEFCR